MVFLEFASFEMVSRIPGQRGMGRDADETSGVVASVVLVHDTTYFYIC